MIMPEQRIVKKSKEPRDESSDNDLGRQRSSQATVPVM